GGPNVIRLAGQSTAAAIFLFATAISSRGEPLKHPLDGLTAREYWAVFETMKASGKLDSSSRYAGINLHEPPKAEVLRWHPGEPAARRSPSSNRAGIHSRLWWTLQIRSWFSGKRLKASSPF